MPGDPVKESRDSIHIDLREYVLHTSDVSILDVQKSRGYYYFVFYEKTRLIPERVHMIAVSEKKHQIKRVPLPRDYHEYISLFVKDGDLIVQLIDGYYFRFNPATWKWKPYSYEKAINGPHDVKRVFLMKNQAGSADVLVMDNNGNSLLNVSHYPASHKPVGQDGFDRLLPFYLDNWESLSVDSVMQEENKYGGEVYKLNQDRMSNLYLPKEYFKENESYHIDKVFKIVKELYIVDTNYWVQESDNSILAVFMDWTRIGYPTKPVHAEKYKEIEGIITACAGPGLKDERTGKYTEWHSGQRTLRLYDEYGIRFIVF